MAIEYRGLLVRASSIAIDTNKHDHQSSSVQVLELSKSMASPELSDKEMMLPSTESGAACHGPPADPGTTVPAPEIAETPTRALGATSKNVVTASGINHRQPQVNSPITAHMPHAFPIDTEAVPISNPLDSSRQVAAAAHAAPFENRTTREARKEATMIELLPHSAPLQNGPIQDTYNETTAIEPLPQLSGTERGPTHDRHNEATMIEPLPQYAASAQQVEHGVEGQNALATDLSAIPSWDHQLYSAGGDHHNLPFGVADEGSILPVAAENALGEFADDTYSEVASSTTSMSSSIMNYKFEYGRRFHAYKEGAYFLPNDDEEQVRMDLQYSACDCFWDQKIYFAPLENPRRILDCGTGTGIWAMEMGDKFPTSEVIGLDLSPIQPRWAPPNVIFQIDDVEEDWTFEENYFDYVHTRLLLCGSIKDFRRLFEQASPGGYVEIQEIQTDIRSDDFEFPEDCALKLWCKLLREAINLMEGRTLEINGERIKRQMENIGFQDVVVEFRKCPIGDWPANQILRRGGALQLAAMLHGLHGLTIAAFTRCLHWSVPEIEVLLAKTRQEFMNRKAHLWWPSYIVYGKKPSYGD